MPTRREYRRSLRARLATTLMAVAFLAAGGCEGNIGGPGSRPTDPCGPPTRSGKYYDFKTKLCVVPTSEEQLAALYDYAQLVRIAAAGDPAVGANIEFTSALSPTTFSDLAAAPPLAVVDEIELFFPDLIDGLRSGVLLIPATSGTHALDLAHSTLRERYADPALPIEQTISDGLDSAFSTGDLAIGRLRVHAHASELLSFWEAHSDDTAYIQPLDSPVPWPDESPEFLK